MPRYTDILLEDYLKRNKDIRQIDVAEALGMNPGFISRQKGKGNFYIRLNGRRQIIGHSIYKEARFEIPRRKLEAKKRRLAARKKRRGN